MPEWWYKSKRFQGPNKNRAAFKSHADKAFQEEEGELEKSNRTVKK